MSQENVEIVRRPSPQLANANQHTPPALDHTKVGQDVALKVIDTQRHVAHATSEPDTARGPLLTRSVS